MKAVLLMLLLGGVLGLAGCESLARSLEQPVMAGSPFAVQTSDFGCPHPREEVEKAEEYVGTVYYLPLDELRKTAVEITEASGGSAEDVGPLIGGFWSEPDIYINSDRSKKDQQHSYIHELCHVYEVKVLGLPFENTHSHEGWRSFGDPIRLGTFQSSP